MKTTLRSVSIILSYYIPIIYTITFLNLVIFLANVQCRKSPATKWVCDEEKVKKKLQLFHKQTHLKLSHERILTFFSHCFGRSTCSTSRRGCHLSSRAHQGRRPARARQSRCTSGSCSYPGQTWDNCTSFVNYFSYMKEPEKSFLNKISPISYK